MGDYRSHIICDITCEWLHPEPYVVVVEPNIDVDHLYVLPRSKYELGPTPVQDDIGPCEICGSSENTNPCFSVSSEYDPVDQDIEIYFHSNHSTLCTTCLEEFRKPVEQIEDKFREDLISKVI